MKSGIFFATSLVLFFANQCELCAGLVIRSVSTVDNSYSSFATVNVSVYGEQSGSPNPELVSTFGLRLTLNGLTNTATIAAPSIAPAASQWSAFPNKTASTNTTSTVTFQSHETNSGVAGIQIFSAPTLTPSNLIGTFSFTVNKAAAVQNFSVAATAFTAVQGIPTAGTPSDGFSTFASGFYQTISTSFNDPINGAGTIAIVAVPEPSSFALLGLVAGCYMLRRRKAS